MPLKFFFVSLCKMILFTVVAINELLLWQLKLWKCLCVKTVKRKMGRKSKLAAYNFSPSKREQKEINGPTNINPANGTFFSPEFLFVTKMTANDEIDFNLKRTLRDHIWMDNFDLLLQCQNYISYAILRCKMQRCHYHHVWDLWGTKIISVILSHKHS